LIDSSESVQPQLQRVVTDVEQLISQSSRNPGDKISVVSFSGLDAHLVCIENCRTSFRADRIGPRGGATPLLDAIDLATTLLIKHRQPDVWPVILLFYFSPTATTPSARHPSTRFARKYWQAASRFTLST
jgi:Mg-chelatase subunit ChlD